MRIRKFYKQVIDAVGGEIPLDKQLVQANCIIGIVLSFFGIAINSLLNFNPLSVLALIFSASFYGLFLLLGRKSTDIIKIKHAISVFNIIIVNLLWFYNFGSKGPAIYMFIFVYSFYIFLWDKRNLTIYFVILTTNILVIFILDQFLPHLTDDYASYQDRIYDVYSGILTFGIINLTLLTRAKKDYIHQYEKAIRSDKLKSAFIANISHEIRTPMNAIVGFSSLLTEEDISQDNKLMYSQIVRDNGDALIHLIEDILDISKIESKQLTITPKPCNVSKSMKKMQQSYARILENKGKTELVFNVVIPHRELIIITDQKRIQQIVSNLLDNAIKFTEKGFIEFGYKEREAEIEFYVQDSGIGIKEENYDKLFNRFTRLNESKTNTYSGTGIGLFLSKHLVHLLGGKIWFTSQYLQGTTFYFTIPKTQVLAEGEPIKTSLKSYAPSFSAS